jgi:hypothetical protein
VTCGLRNPVPKPKIFRPFLRQQSVMTLAASAVGDRYA